MCVASTETYINIFNAAGLYLFTKDALEVLGLQNCEIVNDKFGCLQGLTLFLSYAILAAVLGMLQFGYNTGVINAPEVV